MESVSGILYTLYRGTPRHGEWVVACLDGSWQRLLGERLAAACRPHYLERSELCIEILDPAWEQALQGVKKELEEKLCAATGGEVRRVRLSLRAY